MNKSSHNTHDTDTASKDRTKAGVATSAKRVKTGEKLRGEDKMARVPVKFAATRREDRLPKPKWIRAKFPGTPEVIRLKGLLRNAKLHTVCEEASCPNLGECFGNGTATFMIMGDICTRRCPFCDVAHGRPNALDQNEPDNLAETIALMELRYVVITSVDRDDLRDGGAAHFTRCIKAVRERCPDTKIEILTPDFRGRMDVAIGLMTQTPPDVFNHNLESIPRLYKRIRPGSDYQHSLTLLSEFKKAHPQVLTKSGLMLGLGEEISEVQTVLRDMHRHDIDMVTLGQYLQPTRHHLPVERYVHPDEFKALAEFGERLGFHHIASGPMVRSSYHADLQADAIFTSD